MRRRTLLGSIIVAGAAWCCADEEKIWREYLEWYRRQPAGNSGAVGAYIEILRKSGRSEADLRGRARILERLSRERRGELQPLFFDRTYTSEAPRFNTEPNTLLVEAVRNVKPGRALDIHMGQGRNALFLASRGWAVTGFDYSAEGVRVARAAAAKAGVKLAAVVARHEDFDFGRERWDLVVMSYTWVPLRGGPHIDRIVASLAPGGLLVFEHLMDESGSERAAAWLPRPNELPQLFGCLRILCYEDVRARADWSWRPERIARLVAGKAVPPR